MKMFDEYLYRHYRFSGPDGKSKSAITICIGSPSEWHDGAISLLYGVAFCSPKEKEFRKAVGIEISTERKENHGRLIIIPKSDNLEQTFNRILLQMVVDEVFPYNMRQDVGYYNYTWGIASHLLNARLW